MLRGQAQRDNLECNRDYINKVEIKFNFQHIEKYLIFLSLHIDTVDFEFILPLFCGSIIKQPESASKSQRSLGIQGSYVIPNQSGAITHMVVEKDEKQLLTAGYLLGLGSL